MLKTIVSVLAYHLSKGLEAAFDSVEMKLRLRARRKEARR